MAVGKNRRHHAQQEHDVEHGVDADGSCFMTSSVRAMLERFSSRSNRHVVSGRR